MSDYNNVTTIEKEKERLRKLLNPSIYGENTDKVLESLAAGPAHLIYNVTAVTDQLYLSRASGRYLDELMAERNLTRPDNVGLSDDVFRELGIEISNRKQVRDLLLRILEILYGAEFTRANLNSTQFEPYNLSDQDSLIISFDDEETVEIILQDSQFTNISSATAQEVADAITRELRRLGRKGIATARDDGSGGYVRLSSETVGPSSSVKVLGGKAQNIIRFPQIRPTTNNLTTQWELSIVSGGQTRATWTGGSNPSLGKVKKGDYVNIYGSAFDSSNQGTYTITKVQGGLVGNAYVEFDNTSGVSETVIQGTEDAILFYNPVRNTITSGFTYASVYQTESRLLEIFMPATTKVVRRERKGASYIVESGSSSEDAGPYIYDETKEYIIGGEECNLVETVDANTGLLISVDDASDIPDEEGFLVFGFGTNKEEGPIPYISRPSDNSIIINPSYNFEQIHESGTNISLIAQNYAYNLPRSGEDYPMYLTDIVSGRIYAEDLIELVKATGINVVITILYPNDIGLSKWGDEENSDKYWVWGPDLT
jgi:hypothetical protein